MTEGIRATVRFTDPDVCPIARLSSETSSRVSSVSVSVCSGGCNSCVRDFAVHAEQEPDTSLEPVFSRGSVHLYRMERDCGEDPGCPCELLGERGVPIDQYSARDGELTTSFYAEDYEQLRDAVGDLRESYPDVDVRRLIGAPAEDVEADEVLVDRGKLTARQHEVLETAYRMGYFDRPRQANATEVAEEVGVEPSTASEHLAAAQSKILEDVLME